jgi:hypothetical protein
MIRARVTSTWNPNAEQQLLDQAMTNLLRRARKAVPSVTCSVHHSTHRVLWTQTKQGLEAIIEEPCCDAVHGDLNAAADTLKR